MGKFILTEEERSYIQSLYNLNEQTATYTLKQVQALLKQKGYDLGSSGTNRDGVDGHYGEKTATALLDFLKKQNSQSTNTDDQSNTESDSSSAEESEVSKIEKQLNGVSAQEVSSSSEESSKRVMIARDMKKDSRKDCRTMVANARYSNRKNIPLENSGINKEALSYCLNTYMRRGEKKVRQWAGIN